jgi:phage terminase large subunit
MTRTTKTFSRLVESVKVNRETFMQGSTGSSKTYSALQLIIALAGYLQDQLIFSVVSETYPHLRRGAMRDFFTILGDSYCPDAWNKTEGVYKFGNSLIEFFSADNDSKVRGGRRDFLFINEVNNINKPTYGQLEIRTRLRIMADFNPVERFFAHDLVGRPGVGFFVSTYRDNPFLEKSIVDSIERRRETDPNWYRIYGEGEIGIAEGLIFPLFSQVESFPPPHLLDLEIYGLDFGFTNAPSALLHIGIKNSNLFVDELIYEAGLKNSQIAARFETFGIKKNYDEIFADAAEPKSIEEIKSFGYNIKAAPKGEDSIRAGISKIKEYKINITKRSLGTIKEFRNYKYIQESDGKFTNKPIDDYNHACDALRYGLIGKMAKKKGIDYDKFCQ